MDFALQSAETKDIAAALAKAQGSIENALKDSSNPHFKSTFASLASVINAASDELSKNGISVVQALLPAGEDVLVVTTLHHLSGQWFRSYTPIIMSKNDMQGLGSAITYARRYALSAIVGISQEDDDGNEASKSPKPRAAQNPAEPPWEDEQFPDVAASPGDWRIPFGKKFKGMKLKDVPRKEVEGYLEWLEENAAKKGTPLSSEAITLRDQFERFTKSQGGQQ